MVAVSGMGGVVGSGGIGMSVVEGISALEGCLGMEGGVGGGWGGFVVLGCVVCHFSLVGFADGDVVFCGGDYGKECVVCGRGIVACAFY